MRFRVMLLAVAGALLVGCASSVEVSGPHGWPITAETVAALRKVAPEVRRRWFATMQVPRCEARRRNGEIVVDGVLSEMAWNKANMIVLSQGALGGAVRCETRVRMLWDDLAIYLAFECDDPDVHNTLTKHDDPLWKEDLVELFIDADADGEDYMELHVAPNGATADAIWGDFRKDHDWFMDPQWKVFANGTAHKAWNPKGITSAVKVLGTLNDSSDTDTGYIVEWRIPYSGLVNLVGDEQAGREKIDMTLFKQTEVQPPKLNDVWRMNFNRGDTSIKVKTINAKGEEVDAAEYSAWAPTTGSFHMPMLFGRVVFVE